MITFLALSVRVSQEGDFGMNEFPFTPFSGLIADETGPQDDGEPSSLVAYGGNGDGDQPTASVSLVPARTYVSASAKAAADGPNNPVDPGKGSGPKITPHDRWAVQKWSLYNAGISR